MLNPAVLSRLRSRCSWFSLLLLAGTGLPLGAQTNMEIYTDSLQNSWENWGWATLNYNNTTPVHSGSRSISVTITTNTYQGIYLHHAALDTSSYTNLTFWIHGGAGGGQQLQVQALLGTSPQAAVPLSALAANTWQQITLSLSALGVANQPNFTGFWIQDRIGSPQPTFYLDDLTLVAGSTPPPVTNTAVAIVIDAGLNRHPISPLIYGVAFASSNQLSDLNFPLNRSGGNAETRYNWQLNAHNRGADWYFESLADSPATPGAAADSFIADSKSGGAQPMVTVPMIGWAPKLGSGRARLASYSIAKYGLQDDHDWQWFPDAGNGVVTNTSILITTNNPNDANFPTNSSFQEAWVRHLTNRWGLSANGGVRYYLMDNEHSIWHSTHRDIHPVGATMTEIRDKMFEYAGMVKSNDPNALVLGPEEFGWSGYFYSGYDLWYGSQHGWSNLPDRAANGGWDYMPWLLDQFQRRATNTGQRLLDYFTLHCYPEDGNVAGSDVATATQLLRNRLTRKFWDTNYVDETWIGGQTINIVKLIPRMKGWVAAYYPGTKIGITEYNWGAESHINGATAQADLLGIFGREGLDLATRWATPASTTPTYKAMKMYRNYDGNKSTFGDTSVSATVPNPDEVAAFAAVRSTDSALTIAVINKQLTASSTAAFTLNNFLPGGAAQAWQLTSANAITRLGDINSAGGRFTNTVPPQSMTLYILPAGALPALRASLGSGPGTVNLWLDGQAGQRYAILSSSNLVSWLPMQTNTLATGSLQMVLSTTNSSRFFRAQWLP